MMFSTTTARLARYLGDDRRNHRPMQTTPLFKLRMLTFAEGRVPYDGCPVTKFAVHDTLNHTNYYRRELELMVGDKTDYQSHIRLYGGAIAKIEAYAGLASEIEIPTIVATADHDHARIDGYRAYMNAMHDQVDKARCENADFEASDPRIGAMQMYLVGMVEQYDKAATECDGLHDFVNRLKTRLKSIEGYRF